MYYYNFNTRFLRPTLVLQNKNTFVHNIIWKNMCGNTISTLYETLTVPLLLVITLFK